MPKAKLLPSGNYRVRAYVGKDENGKDKYKSFTDPNKKQAEYLASEYLAGKKEEKKLSKGILLKNAYAEYINLKEAVLSPTTTREYKKCAKTYFQELMNKNINEITQNEIQYALNDEIRKGLSPKTIRNIHGLLSSVFKTFRPDFLMATSLPKKIKNEIKIPSKIEVELIIEKSRGTEMEIPMLMCAGLGLRRSEVCALMWKDIDFKNKTLRIDKAMVQNDKNEWIIKSTPKSTAGNRTIDIFDYIFEVLLENKKETGNITNLQPNVMYKRYKAILKSLNMSSYRLHDLRHYVASVMLALNVPNKYAMEIMGHETENMLNNVYQHTMQEEMKKISNKMNEYYSKK